MMPEPVDVTCPYCGESFSTVADTSAGSQHYVEDCPVCCRPVEFLLEAGPDLELLSLTARRDDD
jgi:transposase-like protein